MSGEHYKIVFETLMEKDHMDAFQKSKLCRSQYVRYGRVINRVCVTEAFDLVSAEQSFCYSSFPCYLHRALCLFFYFHSSYVENLWCQIFFSFIFLLVPCAVRYRFSSNFWRLDRNHFVGIFQRYF
jgi:hypothetical protein